MEWTPILVAGIPALLVFAGVLVTQAGKRDDQRDEKVTRLEERVENLERRLNEESRERRLEQNFSHMLVLEVYTAIQILEVIEAHLEKHGNKITLDFPQLEEVQEVIDKLRKTLSLRPGFTD